MSEVQKPRDLDLDLDPIQGQGQGHGAFELPTPSEAVHAGGDDRSPLAGLSGESLHQRMSHYVIQKVSRHYTVLVP